VFVLLRIQAIWSAFLHVLSLFLVFEGLLPVFGYTTPLSTPEGPFESCTGSTGQREQKRSWCSLPVRSLVPDLRKAEDPLRDEEDVLSPASGFREQAIPFFFFFGELFVFRSSGLGKVQRLGRLLRNLFRLAHVGRVAEDGAFFPVKDVFHHL